jgi:hypothetical protein
MTKLFPKLLSPAVLLYIYLILTTVAQGIYSTSRLEPPVGFTLIHQIGYLWIIGWWLREDSRKQGIAWVYMGLFLNIAWPFIMPYYLLKTRGARGLLVILAFAATYVGAALFGAVLYLAIASLNS